MLYMYTMYVCKLVIIFHCYVNVNAIHLYNYIAYYILAIVRNIENMFMGYDSVVNTYVCMYVLLTYMCIVYVTCYEKI